MKALLADIIRLAKSLLDGDVAQDKATVAGVLIRIVQAAATAHRLHTGQPLDVSLIRVEEPV